MLGCSLEAKESPHGSRASALDNRWCEWSFGNFSDLTELKPQQVHCAVVSEIPLWFRNQPRIMAVEMLSDAGMDCLDLARGVWCLPGK
jgi:hypothetical protein